MKCHTRRHLSLLCFQLDLTEKCSRLLRVKYKASINAIQYVKNPHLSAVIHGIGVNSAANLQKIYQIHKYFRKNLKYFSFLSLKHAKHHSIYIPKIKTPTKRSALRERLAEGARLFSSKSALQLMHTRNKLIKW